MTALIYLTGIAVFALVIYLTLELAPAAPTGRLSEILTPADGVVLTGWRKSLSPLDKPVSKWTPVGFLRKTRADLYWAHIGERWNDWNEVQFTSLRVALAVAGFGLGMVATAEPVFALVGVTQSYAVGKAYFILNVKEAFIAFFGFTCNTMPLLRQSTFANLPNK